MELSDDALVLVAIMPNPRDLDIARLLGWYRIPLKSAPKILHPDAIAFYQTASFSKGHRSQIEYYAGIRQLDNFLEHPAGSRGILQDPAART